MRLELAMHAVHWPFVPCIKLSLELAIHAVHGPFVPCIKLSLELAIHAVHRPFVPCIKLNLELAMHAVNGPFVPCIKLNLELAIHAVYGPFVPCIKLDLGGLYYQYYWPYYTMCLYWFKRVCFLIPECGSRPAFIRPALRVVGGDIADPNAWPWHVSVFGGSDHKYFCGATIIDKNWILTAGHCLGG